MNGRAAPRATRPVPQPFIHQPSTFFFFFFFFFTLVTRPRRSLSLRLSDARVYEPQIRALSAQMTEVFLTHDWANDELGRNNHERVRPEEGPYLRPIDS